MDSSKLAVTLGTVVLGITMGCGGSAESTGNAASDLANCANLTAPVYEAVRPSDGDALLTTSASEAANAASKYGFTENHGTLVKASTSSAPGLTPVYRLYNPSTGDFFFVETLAEKQSAMTKYGYTSDEGVAFYASLTSAGCTVPVHRFLNVQLTKPRHRMAVTQAERSALLAAGWTDEGVHFYAASPGSSTPPPPTPPDAGVPAGDAGVAPPPGGGNDHGIFSIIVMPDVQREMWTPAGQGNWHNRVQWIIDHKASDNIRAVLQVGDLTDTDSCGGGDVVNGECSQSLRDWGTYYPILGQPTHYQFANADSGLRMLEQAQIPFILTPGNHDTAIVCGGPACYGHPEWSVPSPSERNLLRVTNQWNKYFPVSRFKYGAGEFESGKSDNMFHVFSAGGVYWLVINFELYPRAAAIDWAKSVVASHPNYNVILLTHSYLSSDGSVGTSREYGDTAPTYLRDNLVKAFPNVKFTFSGHVGRSGHHTESGAQGNTVHSFLDTYHDTTNNLMRVVTFDVPNNKITTYVYAPLTNYYEVTTQTYDVQFVH